jgi:hypothetical protein
MAISGVVGVASPTLRFSESFYENLPRTGAGMGTSETTHFLGSF